MILAVMVSSLSSPAMISEDQNDSNMSSQATITTEQSGAWMSSQATTTKGQNRKWQNSRVKNLWDEMNFVPYSNKKPSEIPKGEYFLGYFMSSLGVVDDVTFKNVKLDDGRYLIDAISIDSSSKESRFIKHLIKSIKNNEDIYKKAEFKTKLFRKEYPHYSYDARTGETGRKTKPGEDEYAYMYGRPVKITSNRDLHKFYLVIDSISQEFEEIFNSFYSAK
jgi:hypothetical protein